MRATKQQLIDELDKVIYPLGRALLENAICDIDYDTASAAIKHGDAASISVYDQAYKRFNDTHEVYNKLLKTMKKMDMGDPEYDEHMRLVDKYGFNDIDLGDLYDDIADMSNEVRRDFEKAKQGDPSAQYNMGVAFDKGDGIEQNKVKAVEWYTKAAEQGYMDAHFNLGKLYAEGRGLVDNAIELNVKYGAKYVECNSNEVARDRMKAAMWYKKAAEQGHAKSQYNLGLLLDNREGNKWRKKAIKNFTKSAKQGDIWSQCFLGDFYFEGDITDKQTAFKWYKKAAEQGNAEGQYKLGRCYHHNSEISYKKRNQEKAYMWYNKAAEQGYDEAKAAIISLGSGGSMFYDY